MKYAKKQSAGAFLKKGEEIKNGDIVTIGSEGKQVQGEFGMQNVFLVKTADGKEGNTTFNQTTLNGLIDAFGEDSKNWIGKQVKVWSILSNVQGKMRNVFYFTHVRATIDAEGNWTVPAEGTSGITPPPPGTTQEKEIDVDEIPF